MQNFKTEHIFCACPKPDQSEPGFPKCMSWSIFVLNDF
jgi:hypothetical protein